MARSSFLTEASGMRLEEGNCCYSQTMPTLPPCMLPCCKMMEWSITKERGLEGVKEEVAVEARSQKSVLGSTAKQVVISQKQDVSTCIPVSHVGKQGTESMFVGSEGEQFGMKPKYYLHYNLWDEEGSPKITVAEWTQTACSLPQPPPSELENHPACRTLLERPDLFIIFTPVRVEVLESLLEHHPNHPFIDSVLSGLREGF